MTVAEYLKSVPAERRKTLAAVRRTVRANLPPGYKEVFRWRMITWEIPLSTYRDTYNGEPLAYVALAAQKNYFALYLMADPAQRKALELAFERAGRKMDMGKSCLRFKSLDDLPLDAIGRAIRGTPPARLIARHEASRRKA